MRGTVKWFNDSKGYGFVSSTEYSEDIFIHYSAIQGEGSKTLIEGQLIDFELLGNGPKAPQATNIWKVLE